MHCSSSLADGRVNRDLQSESCNAEDKKWMKQSWGVELLLCLIELGLGSSKGHGGQTQKSGCRPAVLVRGVPLPARRARCNANPL